MRLPCSDVPRLDFIAERGPPFTLEWPWLPSLAGGISRLQGPKGDPPKDLAETDISYWTKRFYPQIKSQTTPEKTCAHSYTLAKKTFFDPLTRYFLWSIYFETRSLHLETTAFSVQGPHSMPGGGYFSLFSHIILSFFCFERHKPRPGPRGADPSGQTGDQDSSPSTSHTRTGQAGSGGGPRATRPGQAGSGGDSRTGRANRKSGRVLASRTGQGRPALSLTGPGPGAPDGWRWRHPRHSGPASSAPCSNSRSPARTNIGCGLKSSGLCSSLKTQRAGCRCVPESRYHHRNPVARPAASPAAGSPGQQSSPGALDWPVQR